MEDKIIIALGLIKEFYEKNDGKVYISFSGGKDSTVLLHLVRSLYPNIVAVFSNTTNEHHEVLEYVRAMKNITWVEPKLTFTQVVIKHGFPLVSKEVSQKAYEIKYTNSDKLRNKRLYGDENKNGKLSNKWQFLAYEQFDVTHKCCKILKKDPLALFEKQTGLKPIVGIMGDESRLRMQLKLYGKISEDKCYPFLYSNVVTSDIYKYANDNNIRFAECYYGDYALTRTGCSFCAFGATLEENSRFERLSILKPKQYEKMMKLENNGVTFRVALEKIGVVK